MLGALVRVSGMQGCLSTVITDVGNSLPVGEARSTFIRAVAVAVLWSFGSELLHKIGVAATAVLRKPTSQAKFEKLPDGRPKDPLDGQALALLNATIGALSSWLGGEASDANAAALISEAATTVASFDTAIASPRRAQVLFEGGAVAGGAGAVARMGGAEEDSSSGEESAALARLLLHVSPSNAKRAVGSAQDSVDSSMSSETLLEPPRGFVFVEEALRLGLRWRASRKNELNWADAEGVRLAALRRSVAPGGAARSTVVEFLLHQLSLRNTRRAELSKQPLAAPAVRARADPHDCSAQGEEHGTCVPQDFEKRLREAFDQCRVNDAGHVIVTELSQVCREQKELEHLFQVAENASAIDAVTYDLHGVQLGGERAIGWQEFLVLCAHDRAYKNESGGYDHASSEPSILSEAPEQSFLLLPPRQLSIDMRLLISRNLATIESDREHDDGALESCQHAAGPLDQLSPKSLDAAQRVLDFGEGGEASSADAASASGDFVEALGEGMQEAEREQADEEQVLEGVPGEQAEVDEMHVDKGPAESVEAVLQPCQGQGESSALNASDNIWNSWNESGAGRNLPSASATMGSVSALLKSQSQSQILFDMGPDMIPISDAAVDNLPPEVARSLASSGMAIRGGIPRVYDFNTPLEGSALHPRIGIRAQSGVTDCDPASDVNLHSPLLALRATHESGSELPSCLDIFNSALSESLPEPEAHGVFNARAQNAIRTGRSMDASIGSGYSLGEVTQMSASQSQMCSPGEVVGPDTHLGHSMMLSVGEVLRNTLASNTSTEFGCRYESMALWEHSPLQTVTEVEVSQLQTVAEAEASHFQVSVETDVVACTEHLPDLAVDGPKKGAGPLPPPAGVPQEIGKSQADMPPWPLSFPPQPDVPDGIGKGQVDVPPRALDTPTTQSGEMPLPWQLSTPLLVDAAFGGSSAFSSPEPLQPLRQQGLFVNGSGAVGSDHFTDEPALAYDGYDGNAFRVPTSSSCPQQGMKIIDDLGFLRNQVENLRASLERGAVLASAPRYSNQPITRHGLHGCAVAGSAVGGGARADAVWHGVAPAFLAMEPGVVWDAPVVQRSQRAFAQPSVAAISRISPALDAAAALIGSNTPGQPAVSEPTRMVPVQELTEPQPSVQSKGDFQGGVASVDECVQAQLRDITGELAVCRRQLQDEQVNAAMLASELRAKNSQGATPSNLSEMPQLCLPSARDSPHPITARTSWPPSSSTMNVNPPGDLETDMVAFMTQHGQQLQQMPWGSAAHARACVTPASTGMPPAQPMAPDGWGFRSDPLSLHRRLPVGSMGTDRVALHARTPRLMTSRAAEREPWSSGIKNPAVASDLPVPSVWAPRSRVEQRNREFQDVHKRLNGLDDMFKSLLG